MPEDRCLVEQRVEHARGAEALLQALGDAVDAALAPDVLAEDEQLRGRRSSSSCSAALTCRRACARSASSASSGRVAPNDARALLGGSERRRATRSRTRSGSYGASGATTSSRVASRGRRAASSAAAEHALARLAHEVAQLVRRRRAGLDEAPRVAQQRVARLDRLDLGRPCGRSSRRRCRRGPTGAPSAGAGTPAGARRGSASIAVAGRVPDLVELAVGPEVAQVRRLPKRRRDPAVRASARDADAVVLAHEQDRHRQALPHRVARRVDPRERRGVVGGRVAERADHDRVRRAGRCRRPRRVARARRRRSPPPSAGAGDRRRLRRDPQRAGCPTPCGGPPRSGPRCDATSRAACRAPACCRAAGAQRAIIKPPER